MLTVAADEDSMLAMIRGGGTEAAELAFSGEKRQCAGVTTHAIQAGSDLSTQLPAVFNPVVDFLLQILAQMQKNGAAAKLLSWSRKNLKAAESDPETWTEGIWQIRP